MTGDGLAAVLEGRQSRPQELIEVLQDVNDAEGYVSEEAMRAISACLEVPLIETYRVANFYKSLSLKPRGKHVLTFCMGTACHVRGSQLLLDEAAGQLGIAPGETTDDRLFTLERVNCLGACALGPVIAINDVYHGHMTPAKLRKLIGMIQSEEKEVASHV